MFKKLKQLSSYYFLIPLTKWYLSKPRKWNKNGIRLEIPVGVFHPGLFFSTNYLLQYLLSFELKNQNVLELGAGSGLISIALAKKGANLMSTDISMVACKAIQRNGEINKVKLSVYQSDLFDKLPNEARFDLIVINPPYYPSDPVTEADHAWFCGNDFNYFKKLFMNLQPRLLQNGKCIMVLSEDCVIDLIASIAMEHNLVWKQINKKKIFWEWNYLFEITAKEI